MHTPEQQPRQQAPAPARIRGIADVKTACAAAPAGLAPHKVYLKLFSLEAKRDRARKARDAAAASVALYDQRCRAIQAEVDHLLADLRRRFPGASLPEVPPIVRTTRAAREAAQHPGFTHRY